MLYSTESHIDQKSYATKSRTDEMTFDEMSCTRQAQISLKILAVLGQITHLAFDAKSRKISLANGIIAIRVQVSRKTCDSAQLQGVGVRCSKAI